MKVLARRGPVRIKVVVMEGVVKRERVQGRRTGGRWTLDLRFGFGFGFGFGLRLEFTAKAAMIEVVGNI